MSTSEWHAEDVHRRTPGCEDLVEARIPAPGGPGVWQYISLPRGAAAQAGTLRTGYCEDMQGKTSTHRGAIVYQADERMSEVWLERQAPRFHITFQYERTRIRWIRSASRRPDGHCDRSDPLPRVLNWTESSILAQDERWRRA